MSVKVTQNGGADGVYYAGILDFWGVEVTELGNGIVRIAWCEECSPTISPQSMSQSPFVCPSPIPSPSWSPDASQSPLSVSPFTASPSPYQSQSTVSQSAPSSSPASYTPGHTPGVSYTPGLTPGVSYTPGFTPGASHTPGFSPGVSRSTISQSPGSASPSASGSLITEPLCCDFDDCPGFAGLQLCYDGEGDTIYLGCLDVAGCVGPTVQACIYTRSGVQCNLVDCRVGVGVTFDLTSEVGCYDV